MAHNLKGRMMDTGENKFASQTRQALEAMGIAVPDSFLDDLNNYYLLGFTIEQVVKALVAKYRGE